MDIQTNIHPCVDLVEVWEPVEPGERAHEHALPLVGEHDDRELLLWQVTSQRLAKLLARTTLSLNYKYLYFQGCIKILIPPTLGVKLYQVCWRRISSCEEGKGI